MGTDLGQLAILQFSQRLGEVIVNGLGQLSEREGFENLLFSSAVLCDVRTQACTGHHDKSIYLPGPDDPHLGHRRGWLWTVGCHEISLVSALLQYPTHHGRMVEIIMML